jgi:hypothetical protein
LTLHRREEHGNTFAPEIELSIGFDGIPLNGEEIIERYRQEKTLPAGLICHPVANSIWLELGQIPPHHCQYRTNHWQPKYLAYI